MHICAECGAAYERQHDRHNGHCDDCSTLKRRRERQDQGHIDRGQTTKQRGYGSRWKRLSERLRRQQDFCLDCGATEDLTLDHSVQSWEAAEAGRTIPEESLAVVCRRCNVDRGPARGPEATDDYRQNSAEQLQLLRQDLAELDRPRRPRSNEADSHGIQGDRGA